MTSSFILRLHFVAELLKKKMQPHSVLSCPTVYKGKIPMLNQEDSMTSLAFLLFTDPEVIRSAGLWVFLSIGAVALFVVFIPTVTWIDSRRKEREAFYKAETFRRMTEASGEGAKAAIEMLREESRLEQIKKREGLKIGGLVCIGVGASLTIFLWAVTHDPAFLVGLIPGFIGVALLVYVLFLAAPVE
jgi:hypothetical protein